jgi:hypothetical protein
MTSPLQVRQVSALLLHLHKVGQRLLQVRQKLRICVAPPAGPPLGSGRDGAGARGRQGRRPAQQPCRPHGMSGPVQCGRLMPASAPRGSDQPEYEPDKDDRCRDLYPKEATKLPEYDFGLSTPIARKRIADAFDRARSSPQRPSDPLWFVEQRGCQQNSSQYRSADPE